MTSGRKKAVSAVFGIFLAFLPLFCGPLFSQAAAGGNPMEEAEKRIAKALVLYDGGEYAACLSLLDGYIGEHEEGSFVFPRRQMARVYRLRALLAYAFRGDRDSYRDEIRSYLKAALIEDPNVELGSISVIPVFVQDQFHQVRAEYLSQFSRTSRRYTLGLFGALVIDPTVVTDPSILQPGFFFSYNLSQVWSISASIRLPLTLPLWDTIRGELGAAWYPAFDITKINPSIMASYVYSLDNLKTYTHSVSLSGQAERITRPGFGFAVRVEVLRLDLILGLESTEALPTYSSIELFGESAFRASFANMSIFLTYTF